MRFFPSHNKIEIKVSKLLVRAAAEDAAMWAVRREVERQIREQTVDTTVCTCQTAQPESSQP